MTTLTAALPSFLWETPSLNHTAEHLERAADQLWRVIDTGGSIRGHLRVVADPLGVRYRAERMHLSSGGFQLVGEFWSADDAVAALRH